LKTFHYISDALRPIERLALRPTDDYYHQPKTAKKPRAPYNPKTFLKGCITTSGAESYHYTGTRRYTPRELSLFQSFPCGYHFTGSQSEATKQIGNAFPPVMAEALYQTIAKTLEAFDQGHIEAEDDLSDLDGMLERKGVKLRNGPSLPRPSFDIPSRPANLQSRYLVRDQPRSARSSPPNRPRFAQGRSAQRFQRNVVRSAYDTILRLT
jgi:DNA (cytosine-5)-methyltransferase 1